MSTLKINMKQINRWKVDSDNVKFYNHIVSNKGSVMTLDARGYVEFLIEFNIFYTLS